MLTEALFIEQLRQLGRKIHEYDGVFWEQTYPFYCRPAFVYRAFERGKFKPHPYKCLFGYSHLTESEQGISSYRSFMEIDRYTLDIYSIDLLKPRRRTQVRKALRDVDIKLIDRLDSELLERVRQINVAQALRQEKGNGSETPATRYIKEKNEWEKQIIQEFNLEFREWWGAFHHEKLIAYIKTYQVDGIRIIEHTKADTESLSLRPMDALYFKVIELAKNDKLCNRLVNGTPIHSSLNRYKEDFLFKEVKYPYYNSNQKIVNLVKKLIKK